MVLVGETDMKAIVVALAAATAAAVSAAASAVAAAAAAVQFPHPEGGTHQHAIAARPRPRTTYGDTETVILEMKICLDAVEMINYDHQTTDLDTIGPAIRGDAVGDLEMRNGNHQ